MNRHVDVAPHGTLIHFAVGYADIEEPPAQFGKICAHLGGRAHIRRRHDLDQRHTAAVVIDVRTVVPVY